MDKKRSFLVYLDYWEHLKLLTVSEVGELFLAIFRYEDTRELPAFSGALQMCFSFMRRQLDRDRAAYEEKCRVNRLNGRKGGRPPKEENPFRDYAEADDDA